LNKAAVFAFNQYPMDNIGLSEKTNENANCDGLKLLKVLLLQEIINIIFIIISNIFCFLCKKYRA